jgi:hypothetical protein
MPLPRIAVYHAEGRWMRSCYLLAFLLERWREAGFETLLLNDPAERVDADAAIVHVDTTVRPEAYDRIADRYPLVVNAAVHDISKRRVSTQFLAPDSAYEGPVILKSDANCFGKPDHARNQSPVVRRLCRYWSRIASARQDMGADAPTDPVVGLLPDLLSPSRGAALGLEGPRTRGGEVPPRASR